LDDPLLPLARATARAFEVRFERPPTGVAVSPGRVNLMGDHTDYNDGFVLPMALGLGTAFAFSPRDDGRLRVHFAASSDTQEASLAELEAPGHAGSFAYVAGVAWALRQKGHALRGMDALVAGSLPIGAGLSSSASLELASARALASAAGMRWDAVAMARLSQQAENDYVGLSCGIMDQYAAAAALEGTALLLDCRSLEARPVPIPDHAMVVVMDTGSRRGLAFSTYNERRASCDTAVRALSHLRPGLRALRDVDEALLQAGRERLDDTTYARAAHVVAESQRPRAMAKAFEIGDLETAGKLMDTSHASLRDLYEVSSPELDTMTELARAHPACYGARLTGAGFGGCAVALVRTQAADAFVAEVAKAYSARRPDLVQSALFSCRPSAGARLVPFSAQ